MPIQCICWLWLQKQDLCSGTPCATSADNALSNHTGDTPEGASNDNGAVARLTIDIDELNKKIAQKDEEVKLYKGRYEDTSKYVAELVSVMSMLLLDCRTSVVISFSTSTLPHISLVDSA